MVAQEDEANFSCRVLDSLVGIGRMGERLGKSIEVRYEIWARGNGQRDKRVECAQAGNDPAYILNTKGRFRARCHGDFQDDNKRRSEHERPPTIGTTKAACR